MGFCQEVVPYGFAMVVLYRESRTPICPLVVCAWWRCLKLNEGKPISVNLRPRASLHLLTCQNECDRQWNDLKWSLFKPPSMHRNGIKHVYTKHGRCHILGKTNSQPKVVLSWGIYNSFCCKSLELSVFHRLPVGFVQSLRNVEHDFIVSMSCFEHSPKVGSGLCSCIV